MAERASAELPLDAELRSLHGSFDKLNAVMGTSAELADAEPATSTDVASGLSAGEDAEQEATSLYGSLMGAAAPQDAAAEGSGRGSSGRGSAGAGPGEPSGEAAGGRPSMHSLGLVQPIPKQLQQEPEESGPPQELEDAGGALDLRTHAKNVLVFSNAGKPVFSLHGDENELAGLMAAAQAIMSVVQRSGQQLKHLRAGRHVIAFLDRNPLYLVASSALGEPPAVLRMQLSLVHGQLASLLTSSALASLFRRSPGYDLRRLLGGTENMLRHLVAGFSASPASALGAFASLPLAPPVRTMVAGALATAVKESGSLFGLVLGGQQSVVSLAAPPGSPLQPWDILLLQNFLLSSPTFLAAEAFTPYCLLHYNPSANLHAYVHFLDAPTRTAVVLLAGSPPDFHALSAARRHMQASLEAAGTLQALLAAVTACSSSDSSPLSIAGSLPKQVGGGPVGTTPLLHFAYRLSAKQQFVMSPFAEPLADLPLKQAVVVAYGQLRAAMFDAAGERVGGSGGGSAPLQKLRFEARRRFCLLASVSSEAELYLTLDPLADKVTAAALHDRLAAWLRARHDELFV